MKLFTESRDLVKIEQDRAMAEIERLHTIAMAVIERGHNLRRENDKLYRMVKDSLKRESELCSIINNLANGVNTSREAMDYLTKIAAGKRDA